MHEAIKFQNTIISLFFFLCVCSYHQNNSKRLYSIIQLQFASHIFGSNIDSKIGHK